METFLVTGATGFIGKALCEHLTGCGHNVLALVRRYDTSLEMPGITQLVSPEFTPDSHHLANVSRIIHCAGNATFGNGPYYDEANITLTKYMLRLAQEACPSLQRFVFVSTIGAIDRAAADTCEFPLDEQSKAHPSSDYGRSKLACEQLVKQSGLPFVIIRPTMVVGDKMRYNSHFAVFARAALSGAWFSRFNWPGKFSVVHVRDVASALLCVAENPDAQNQTFFCAGEPLALGDFFAHIAPKMRRMPLRCGKLRMFARCIPFSAKALFFSALTASDEKLRALGWKPKYSALAALEEVVQREKCRFNYHISPEGQTVITGAASGLGRAFVKKLAPLRGHLLCIDMDLAGLENLKEQYPNVRVLQADLATKEGVNACLSSSEWNMHPIAELFACAGIGPRGEIQATPLVQHRRAFGVNVLARIALGQSAVHSMRNQQFGRLVLISSSSAFQSLPLMATYAATNCALLSLGMSWAYEVKKFGVQVLTVCPGGMQTNFQKNNGVREVQGEKLMTPEEAVNTILNKAQRGKTLVYLSARSAAMALAARVLPRSFSVQLWGFLMSKLR